jgi:hypothetical protein
VKTTRQAGVRNIFSYFSATENNDFSQTGKTRGQYIQENMGRRRRVIFTSGDKPVLDAWRLPDGSLSANSPFAHSFLEALKQGGRNHDVLLGVEIVPFILNLEPRPQDGVLSGTNGDFVFVKPVKEKKSK